MIYPSSADPSRIPVVWGQKRLRRGLLHVVIGKPEVSLNKSKAISSNIKDIPSLQGFSTDHSTMSCLSKYMRVNQEKTSIGRLSCLSLISNNDN